MKAKGLAQCLAYRKCSVSLTFYIIIGVIGRTSEHLDSCDFFFFLNDYIIYFFGCVGSSFLCEGFL